MSTKKRLLVIHNAYPNQYKPYAGWYFEHHVNYHRQLGYDITVLSPGDSRTGRMRVLWKFSKMFLNACRLVVTHNFDLVHTHSSFPAGYMGYIVSRLRNKPMILTSHGVANMDKYARNSTVWQRLLYPVWDYASYIIFVGNKQRDHFEQVVPSISSEKVKVNPMGIRMFTPHNDELHASVNECQISPQKTTLTFIGNMNQDKGVDVFLQAIAQLDVNILDKCCIMIGGDGAYFNTMKKLSVQLGLSDQVEFLGPVMPDDVYRYLSATDICIVPSRRESFGLVAMEAMYCGAVVIASCVGELSENIEDGVNGFLVEPNNAEELAMRIQSVMADTELQNKVRKEARKTAEKFDVDKSAQYIADIYAKLLD